MKAKLLITLGVATLLLVGCKNDVATGGGSSSGESTASTTGTAPAPLVVPEVMKTSDAYHWYGFENTKPIKLTVSAGTSTYTGTQTMVLKAIEGTDAIFEVQRTGELGEQLGTDTVALRPSGAYVIKSTKFKGDSNNLDLPTKMSADSTWKNDGELELVTGEKFEQHLTLKAVGMETVTTKAGSQSAMLVTSTGNVKIDKGNYRMDSKVWYVKDKGLVKSVVTMKSLDNPKQPAQVITIQETK